jgi:hypothetical protein
MQDWSVALGRELRAARLAHFRSQAALSVELGIHQSVISRMELGAGDNVSLATWKAAAEAVGLRLTLDGRDDGNTRIATHTMVAELASRGGWQATVTPDETVIARGHDRAVIHVWEHVTTIRAEVDRFRASVARERIAVARASGIVVIPTIGWNRRRVTELREELRSEFPAAGNAWYRTLVNAHRPMPADAGILWAFQDRARLRPATVLPGWVWTAATEGPRRR